MLLGRNGDQGTEISSDLNGSAVRSVIGHDLSVEEKQFRY